MTKIENIKELRNRTQASYMDCKNALEKANQDVEQAERILIEEGLKIIDSDYTNSTDIGVVNSYIHPGSKIGVMVEVHCETDFVAKTKEFQLFTKEVALQVASMRPKYISREDIDDDLIIAEYNKRIKRLENEGNPATLLDELAFREMNQWRTEVCLLEQTYIKDNFKTIKELLAELVNKVGENCRIKRFVRWEIGNESEEVNMKKNKEEKLDRADLDIAKGSAFFAKLLVSTLFVIVLLSAIFSFV